MGVKSTVELTRTRAIQLAARLYELKNRRRTEAIYTAMEDAELEEALETLNDETHNGEGFNNYMIVSADRSDLDQ